MTWTYGGDPSGSDRDAVRFLVGDTNTADQQMTDEEIAFALDEEGENKYAAAAAIARAIASKFARLVSTSADGLSQQFQQRQDHYKAVAERLESRAVRGSAVIVPSMYAAGITDATESKEVLFRIGMHDDPSGDSATTVDDLDQ